MATIEQLEAVIIARTPVFHRMILRIIRTPNDVEDVLQEALISAFVGLSKFEGRAGLGTWLTRIVLNAAYMHLRRRPKVHFVSIDEPQERTGLSLSEMLASPEPIYLERQSRMVARLIWELRPVHRDAIQMRYLDGLSTHETAFRLNIPVGTVKAKVSRGKKQLRRLVERDALQS
jgi:RNA polymerase sigma-70 factor (ECF subfamily)